MSVFDELELDRLETELDEELDALDCEDMEEALDDPDELALAELRDAFALEACTRPPAPVPISLAGALGDAGDTPPGLVCVHAVMAVLQAMAIAVFMQSVLMLSFMSGSFSNDRFGHNAVSWTPATRMPRCAMDLDVPDPSNGIPA